MNDKPHVSHHPTRRMLADFLTEGLRFVGAGALVFPTGLLVTALLHELAGMPEENAAAVAYCVMLLMGFALARVYVFRVEGAVQRQFARFALISLAMRGAEYLLFLLLFRLFGLGYVLAMAGAGATSSGFKYVLYRVWVFERPLSVRQTPRA